MSDRGSFVTEYLYCEKCLLIAKEHLIKNEKHLKGIQIPSWKENEYLPIIAGKIGGVGSADIYDTIFKKSEEIASKVCHSMRISLISEEGTPDWIFINHENGKATIKNCFIKETKF